MRKRRKKNTGNERGRREESFGLLVLKPNQIEGNWHWPLSLRTRKKLRDRKRERLKRNAKNAKARINTFRSLVVAVFLVLALLNANFNWMHTMKFVFD